MGGWRSRQQAFEGAAVDVLQRRRGRRRRCARRSCVSMRSAGRTRPPGGQMVAMKRPSEVPPVVDSCVARPVTARIAALSAADSAPSGVLKGCAPTVHFRSYSSPCRRRSASIALDQGLGGRHGGEAQVEVDLAGPGDDVGRSGAGAHVRHLEGGRRKEGVAVVPAFRREFGKRGRELMHRVAREVRIRHVALDSAHGQAARERSAPAVLDGVAQRLDGGRLADHAVVDRLAASTQRIDDLHGAIGRRAFFVRGQQQGDRAAMVADARARIPRPRRRTPPPNSSCPTRRVRTARRRGSSA